ncbi:MAG: hypothetical protein AABW47_01615 [Nanoarchaeota archaeon]
MNKIQQLEQKLNEQKNRIGLIGGARAKVQEFEDVEENISVHINLENWGIIVTIKTGYNPIQDDEQKEYARAKNIADGLETIVLQIGGLHETAHWELPLGSGKGCPFDIYNHDKIVEGIKKGLPEDKKGFASFLANAFEDTLINPRCKEFNGDFSGQILFWDEQGLRREKEKRKKGFTPLYEAFVKVNMYLFGDTIDEELLKRHYTNNSKVKKAVNEAIKELNFPKNISDTTTLFNKSQWPIMAEKYARAMAKLLDEMPKERMSAYDSGQGQGSEGQPKDNQKPKSGNGIEKKVGTKEGKEEIAFGRYKSGEGQSPNIEIFEQLDALYQRLAKDIPVRVEAITKEAAMEISPLNYRAFDPEKDNPFRVKISKLFFDKDGVSLAYPNQPLTIDYRQKIQKKSFPNFKMIVIDNSGSMQEGLNSSQGRTNFIPWGDNSKYHWALMGYYGIENFLQKQGISPYIEHGVSLFSASTRYKTGNYNDLVEIRKLLLSPDWGSTNLNAGILKKALTGKESFLLSLSDGEVGNWNSEKSDIRKLVEQNYYAHIQLGSETQMTRDLELWGMPVLYVNSGNDLSKLMVDITKGTYNRFVKN